MARCYDTWLNFRKILLTENWRLVGPKVQCVLENGLLCAVSWDILIRILTYRGVIGGVKAGKD